MNCVTDRKKKTVEEMRDSFFISLIHRDMDSFTVHLDICGQGLFLRTNNN